MQRCNFSICNEFRLLTAHQIPVSRIEKLLVHDVSTIFCLYFARMSIWEEMIEM